MKKKALRQFVSDVSTGIVVGKVGGIDPVINHFILINVDAPKGSKKRKIIITTEDLEIVRSRRKKKVKRKLKKKSMKKICKFLGIDTKKKKDKDDGSILLNGVSSLDDIFLTDVKMNRTVMRNQELLMNILTSDCAQVLCLNPSRDCTTARDLKPGTKTRRRISRTTPKSQNSDDENEGEIAESEIDSMYDGDIVSMETEELDQRLLVERSQLFTEGKTKFCDPSLSRNEDDEEENEESEDEDDDNDEGEDSEGESSDDENENENETKQEDGVIYGLTEVKTYMNNKKISVFLYLSKNPVNSKDKELDAPKTCSEHMMNLRDEDSSHIYNLNEFICAVLHFFRENPYYDFWTNNCQTYLKRLFYRFGFLQKFYSGVEVVESEENMNIVDEVLALEMM